MSKTVANVAVTDTFDTWLTGTNILLDALTNEIVTANDSLGVTDGNAYVNGYFTVSGNVTANGTGAHLVVGTATINTTTIVIDTGNFSTGANVGANVLLTTSSIKVGNATSYVVSNATAGITVSGASAGISPVTNSTGTALGASTKRWNVYANVGNFSGAVTFASTLTANGDTGASGQVLVSNGSVGSPYWIDIGNISPNTTPGGANTTLQFNDSNTFGGDANLTFNKASTLLTIGSTSSNLKANSVSININGAFIANSIGAYHTGTINALSFSVGTSFIANATGAYHTGVVNASSFTSTVFVANTSGTTITGFANVSTSVNAASHTVGTAFIANATGVYHTGTTNSAVLSVGSAFIANATQVTLSGITVSANGGVGTQGQILTSNGSSGSPFWTSNVSATAINVGSTFVANATQITIASTPLSANGGTGTAGHVLTSNGSTGSPYWAAASATASGFKSLSVLTANVTATSATLYVIGQDSVVITLPASPSVLDNVGVSNMSNSANCTVARNGSKIMGATEDMTIDSLNAGFTLFYSGTTYGWVLM